ncbi:MAG: hypothetical protein M3O85_05695 [Acidobacteriota bacterium]|nr:hypothetical protein [Acidobacteriota bacterium]
MKTRLNSLRSAGRTPAVALFLCVMALVGVAAAAQFFGAIFTTNFDGTTVNGNIYQAKKDVYLNGGPQNLHANGLPDGTYYFQVTDPSGAVLLSTDPAACRQVTVSGGKMAGASGPCPHANGAFNPANGTTPVQLIPFNDTPNPGGEYKAWLIKKAAATVGEDGITLSFSNSDSKTDNFKVVKPGAAYVTVCKFNDRDGNGTQDEGDSLIPHWPITATGVDAGNLTNQTVHTQTDDFGCASFSVTSFPQTVTFTEGTLGVDWTQTAPADGSSGAFTVSGGVISVAPNPGDNLQAPNFGNHNPNCVDADTCGDPGLLVTKDANPSNKFTWTIEKSVDKSEIDLSSGSATFNYTVKVSHDGGTGWVATGNIRVANTGPADISGITVTDAVDNGGTCTITDANAGLDETVEAGEHIDVPYTCTYESMPSAGTNTGTASWADGQKTGTAAVDFTNAIIDGSVDVTDTLGGTLGTVSYTGDSPKTFTYSYSVTGVPGTCVTQDNTATFTTNTTSTTGSDGKTVRVCEGKDLTVSKTASAAYRSNITKDVDKTSVKQVGGSATFNYTVKATTSAWTVSGNITVSNPNDWEAITANVGDSLSDGGGSCTVTGGTGVSVGASLSVTLPYSCTFSSVPSANSGVNTGSASWDSAAALTSGSSTSGTANYAFSNLTVKDTFNNSTTTLGTVTVPSGTATYTYAHTIAVPAFNCLSYTNTAVIVQTEQSASQTVTVCGPLKTGALTMGFWQNNNGQGIIKAANQTNLGNWLRAYHPFSNAPSTGLAAYVYNIIKVAQCTSTTSTCNTMLRAQMLATALDVYFSDPALGGNRIGAPGSIGGVSIDLTNIKGQNVSSAFGGATSMTVLQMLAYQNISDPLANAGAIWYGQVKVQQVKAKDAFDGINNGWVFAP